MEDKCPFVHQQERASQSWDHKALKDKLAIQANKAVGGTRERRKTGQVIGTENCPKSPEALSAEDKKTVRLLRSFIVAAI